MVISGIIKINYLLLFIWFSYSSNKYGLFCTEDFDKRVTDPCCENVRVHYKQRTVYEILSLQHDDLRRGINCFQRVCPSQFPAFYRVMYVGGFPGTSVSFAVCSDGEHVNLDGHDKSRGRKRSTKQRKHWIQKKYDNSKINATHVFDGRQFIFRSLDNASEKSNLFTRYMEMIHPEIHTSENTNMSSSYKTFDKTRNRASHRKRREADNSRTIFEIPEPRPSIVYTLTGVCFCLRVQSHPQLNGNYASSQSSDLKSRQVFHATATRENEFNSEKNFDSSDKEFHKNFNKKTFAKHVTKYRNVKIIENLNEAQDRNRSIHCANGKCSFPETIKRRRKRSTFLDLFMKAVLESQKKEESQSMISTSTVSEPYVDSAKDIPHLTTQSTTISDVDKSKTTITKSTNIYTHVSKDVNTMTSKRQLQTRHTTITHDDREQGTPISKSRGRILEDEASHDGEHNAEPVDPEEFKDKLVVFASFSHDVHFIGSISMMVSVASSCRSNLPLSPETNNTSNVTKSVSPTSEEKTTVASVVMKSTKSHNIMKPKNTTHRQENSITSISTATSPKQETIPKSMVEEVPVHSHTKVKDDDDTDDGHINILLVWQVTAGVTFAVLLVLILVLVNNLCRRRRRKQERYSSLTPESTLQRHQNQSSQNNTSTPTAYLSSPAPVNDQRHSETLVTTTHDTITIPRTIQAIFRNDPPQVINVGTVYPMHIMLRSLSAAAEAARLRGQEALRMLNNEKGNPEEDTINTNHSLVAMNPIASHWSGNVTNRDNVIDNNGYCRANHQKTSGIPSKNSNLKSSKQLFSPKIVISEGSNTREFDLGQFAVYRNDIMLKLRGCGLRTGRRKRSPGTGSSRDYDNDENDGAESVYSCYAGGETDI